MAEAVFARDVRGLFSPPEPATAKAFYFPTTPRANKNQKQTTATSDTTGGTGGTSIALTHLQPQNFTTPPLSRSAPVWNLKGDIAEAATAIGGNSPDTSSSSSKYNETWPSRSELASNEGQEHTVGVVEGQKVGVAEDEDNSEGSAAVEGSTLAHYIERFRKAPPTERSCRNRPNKKPFWWQKSDMTSSVMPPCPPQDASTPNTNKMHSYTDPSPQVSDDNSLESRSQELIEKSSSLLSSSADDATDSPPAQKYLNTMKKRTDPAVLSPLAETGHTHPAHGGCSAGPQDILARWRVQRRLEQARQAAMTTSIQHNRCCGSRQDYMVATEGYCGQHSDIHPPPIGCQHRVQQKEPLFQDCVQEKEHPPTGYHHRVKEREHSPTWCHHMVQEREHPPTWCQHKVQEREHPSTWCQHRVEPVSPGKCKYVWEKREDVKEQEVQTSPVEILEPDNEVGGASTEGPPEQPKQTAQTIHNVILPTNEATHTQGDLTPPTNEFKVSLSLSSNNGPPGPTDQPISSSRVTPIKNRVTTPTGQPLPTHGGLALRDTTVSDGGDAEELTLTFTTETEEGGDGHSTPLHSDLIQEDHLTTSPPTATNQPGASPLPCLLPSPPLPLPSNGAAVNTASTSKEDLPPLQKTCGAHHTACGLAWECDMQDEMLRLLISRARHFEAQIREIDCRLALLPAEDQ